MLRHNSSKDFSFESLIKAIFLQTLTKKAPKSDLFFKKNNIFDQILKTFEISPQNHFREANENITDSSSEPMCFIYNTDCVCILTFIFLKKKKKKKKSTGT